LKRKVKKKSKKKSVWFRKLFWEKFNLNNFLGCRQSQNLSLPTAFFHLNKNLFEALSKAIKPLD